MIDTPNTSTVQGYLDTLECCQKDAQNKFSLISATLNSAKDIYKSKQQYHLKLEGIWERLKTTNGLSGDAMQSIALTRTVADNLEGGVSQDVGYIKCLVGEVISYSEKLEQYSRCVDTLLKEIEKIKKAKLDQGNIIIKGLKDLLAAYEEAIKCATAAVEAMLAVLECAYLFQFKLTGVAPDDLLDKCAEEAAAADPCADMPKLPELDFFCMREQFDNDDRCPSSVPPDEFHQGLQKTLEQLQDRFGGQFQLFAKNEDGSYDFSNCNYAKTIHDEMATAEEDMEKAKKCMDAIEKEKDLALSAKDAAANAFKAASDAKKC